MGFCALALFSAHARAGDPKPWDDPECDFTKKEIKLAPEALVREFLTRDARGDFLESEPWMQTVALCAGHLGGPDGFTVISGYEVLKTSVVGDKATVQVKYAIVGTLTSGGHEGELNAFVPEAEKSKTLDFKLVKSPFGWRLDEFPWQMVLVKAAAAHASSRSWVPGDAERFQKAAGLKK